jgi:hypothetical protein
MVTVIAIYFFVVIAISVVASILGWQPRNGYTLDLHRKKGWDDPSEPHNWAQTMHWHDHHHHHDHGSGF